ncbi:tripartite tricarboxylate transporter substrate-binding protein [Variovorax sp. KK3]|nr:tripartite tricarboxylate transporter substrate-binding protein [Variovorax sp. KK3]
MAGWALACTASTAWSQAYPTKPITLVVPFAAGGPTDVVARTLGAAMTRTLGQTVVVENKTGAGGTIAAAYTARATPDGYTFLIHHNGMATAPALYRKLNYKPLADFDYVSQVIDVPMTVVGRKDLPAKDFKELMAYAKANGDKINLAHAGLGAVSHLCGVLLRQAMGVSMTTVPYQGTGPAMNALLAGQVDLLCDQTTSTTPYIKAGSIKLYGVTTASRLKTLPDTPTLAEQGLKDFQVVVWHGIYAPKGTPKEAVDKFGAALRTALKDPAVAQRLAELGAIVPPDAKLTPAGLQSWLQQESARYEPVIKAAGQFAD